MWFGVLVFRFSNFLAKSYDTEFRLSAQLREEYNTLLDVAREQSENDDVCSSELRTVAGGIASIVQYKKKMYPSQRITG